MAVQELRPEARVAPRRHGLATLGLALGATAGAVLGFATAGSDVGTPILLMLLGAALGIGTGVLVAERRARRPAAPAPEPEPIPVLISAPGTRSVMLRPEPEPAPDPLARLLPPVEAPDTPAWLADPADPRQRRLWDGTGWTTHVWRPHR